MHSQQCCHDICVPLPPPPWPRCQCLNPQAHVNQYNPRLTGQGACCTADARACQEERSDGGADLPAPSHQCCQRMVRWQLHPTPFHTSAAVVSRPRRRSGSVLPGSLDSTHLEHICQVHGACLFNVRAATGGTQARAHPAQQTPLPARSAGGRSSRSPRRHEQAPLQPDAPADGGTVGHMRHLQPACATTHAVCGIFASHVIMLQVVLWQGEDGLQRISVLSHLRSNTSGITSRCDGELTCLALTPASAMAHLDAACCVADPSVLMG